MEPGATPVALGEGKGSGVEGRGVGRGELSFERERTRVEGGTHSSAETLESEQPNQKMRGSCPWASFLSKAGSEVANAAAYVSFASRMPCSRRISTV